MALKGLLHPCRDIKRYAKKCNQAFWDEIAHDYGPLGDNFFKLFLINLLQKMRI